MRRVHNSPYRLKYGGEAATNLDSSAAPRSCWAAGRHHEVQHDIGHVHHSKTWVSPPPFRHPIPPLLTPLEMDTCTVCKVPLRQMLTWCLTNLCDEGWRLWFSPLALRVRSDQRNSQLIPRSEMRRNRNKKKLLLSLRRHAARRIVYCAASR